MCIGNSVSSFFCYSSSFSDHNVDRVPNGDIMEDLMTDREEAFFENEMSELVKHLEDEYRKSAIGNWNKLRQLILRRYFSQAHSKTSVNHNEMHLSQKTPGASVTPKGKTENSYTSRQRPPTPPLVQRTVIQVGSLSESGSSSRSGYGHQRSAHEVPPKSPTKVKFSSG